MTFPNAADDERAPCVSVLIATYDGAATVGRALESVFRQTFVDFEVVVVNDGSIDDTAAVLTKYDERICIITRPNRGVSAARNVAARSSVGEYVAFLDDDDEWLPEKLARCVAVLNRDKACALVYTDACKIDVKGHPMRNQEGGTGGVDSPSMAQMLARPWNVVPSQLVMRRSAFERSVGFDERLASCEDLLFLLGVREFGYFRRIPESLLRKTTRPLYPKALNREPHCDLFIRLVRERYGSSATGLIREFRRQRTRTLQHIARVLMEEGRPIEARRCLARVIHYQPTSLKVYRRYLNTFLAGRSTSTSILDES